MILTTRYRPKPTQRYGSRVQNWAFYALFPGFFFYHSAVAKGLIPPFFGGYFGLVSVALIGPLFLRSYRIFLPRTFDSRCTFLLLMLFTTFNAALHYILDTPDGLSRDMLHWSLSGVLFNLVCFLMASGLYLNGTAGLKVLQTLMGTIVLLNVGELGFFYLKEEAVENAGFVASYAGFARSLLVVSLLLIGLNFNCLRKLIFWAGFSSFLLYLNGARAEFIGFLIAVIFALLFKNRNGVRLFKIILLALVSLMAAITIGIEFLPESRMSELLNIFNSSSFLARAEMFGYALKIIKSDPMFGSYGEYAIHGGLGAYPHNIFSAWVNLGFVGFSLYLILFSQIWIWVLKRRKKYQHTLEYSVALLFIVYTTFAVFAAKEASYMLIGFTVGIMIRSASEVPSYRNPSSERVVEGARIRN